MGRRSYRVRATGYTEAEALKAAIEADIQENGTQDGYNGSIYSDDGGMKSKCLVQPTKGKITFSLDKHEEKTRKWETMYRSYQTEYGREVQQLITERTQAKCIEETKRFMERHGIETANVRQVNVCTSGNSLCGQLNNKATPGEWVFWGEGRE